MAKKLFNETPEFLAEHAKWTEILEKSGFVDIEKGEQDTVLRPQIIKTAKNQYDGGNSYYELCQTILREFDFKRDTDRAIFELHSNGKSLREIEEWLKIHSIKKLKKTAIQDLIIRIKERYLKGSK